MSIYCTFTFDSGAQLSTTPEAQINFPVWYDLKGLDGNGNFGQILLHYQIIPKGELKSIQEPDIFPIGRRSWIDCHLVGLRNLKKFGRFPLYRYNL
jgi:hypothetical protein